MGIRYESTNLIEAVPVADVYADDIGSIEILGGNVRVTFVTYRFCQNAPGLPPDRIVVAKIIRPVNSITGGGRVAKVVTARFKLLS